MLINCLLSLLIFSITLYSGDKNTLDLISRPTRFVDPTPCYGPGADEGWTFDGPDAVEAIKNAKISLREEKIRQQQNIKNELEAFRQRLLPPPNNIIETTSTTSDSNTLTAKQRKKQRHKAKKLKEQRSAELKPHCSELPQRFEKALQFLGTAKPSKSNSVVPKLPFHSLPNGVQCALGTSDPKETLAYSLFLAKRQINYGDAFLERFHEMLGKLHCLHDPLLPINPIELELLETHAQIIANAVGITEDMLFILPTDFKKLCDTYQKQFSYKAHGLITALSKARFTKKIVKRRLEALREKYELKLLHYAIDKNPTTDSILPAIDECKKTYRGLEERIFDHITVLAQAADLQLEAASEQNILLTLYALSKRQLQILLLEDLLFGKKRKTHAQQLSSNLYRKLHECAQRHQEPLTQEFWKSIESFNNHMRITRPLAQHARVTTDRPDEFNTFELLHILQGVQAQAILIEAHRSKFEAVSQFLDLENVAPTLNAVSLELLRWQKYRDQLQHNVCQKTASTCGSCSTTLPENALVCNDCKIQYYCSETCAIAHKENHHAMCILLKNPRAKIELPPLRFFILVRHNDGSTTTLDNRGLEYAHYANNHSTILELTTKKLFALKRNEVKECIEVLDPVTKQLYPVKLFETKTTSTKSTP